MTQLDMRGNPCPIPVIEAKKALAKMQPGEELAVLVDNQPACENLKRMASGYGCPHTVAPDETGAFTVTITAAAAPDTAGTDAAEGQGLAVAIGSDAMGHGSEELGRILIKGFIYSLGQLPRLPVAIAFFNAGVRLALQDSNTLEDLQALESKGVRIMVCGTCADYYGVKEQVAVGNIVNMYQITTQLAEAPSVINL